MSKFLLTFTLLFTACGVRKLDDGEATDLDNLYIDPDGDEDEDGWTVVKNLTKGQTHLMHTMCLTLGGGKKTVAVMRLIPQEMGLVMWQKILG